MAFQVRDWIRSRRGPLRAVQRHTDPLPGKAWEALADVAGRVHADHPELDDEVGALRSQRAAGRPVSGKSWAAGEANRLRSARPVVCPECGRQLRVDTIRRHQRTQHPAE